MFNHGQGWFHSLLGSPEPCVSIPPRAASPWGGQPGWGRTESSPSLSCKAPHGPACATSASATASTLATCPCQPLGCQLLGTHSYHLLKRAALGQWEPACLEGLEECAHPQEGPWAIVTWCETPAFASEQDNLCDTCHTQAPVGSSMTGYPTPRLFWVLPWPGLLPSPLTSLLRPLPRWTTCTNIPISGPDSGEPNLRCKIPVSSLLLLSILPAYFAQWHSGTFTKPPQICMCMLSCFSHVRTLWPHRLQHSRLPCPFAQTHDIESAI